MARKRDTSKGRSYIDIYGIYHTGYTHRTKSGKHQLNMAWELKDVLNQYAKELIDAKEDALDEAADFLLERLIVNSPKDSGEFKKSWLRTDKYTGVRYLGNSKIAGKNKIYGGNIPLSNIIEFSKNGKPFIRNVFKRNKGKIIQIVKEHLNNASKE